MPSTLVVRYLLLCVSFCLVRSGIHFWSWTGTFQLHLSSSGRTGWSQMKSDSQSWVNATFQITRLPAHTTLARSATILSEKQETSLRSTSTAMTFSWTYATPLLSSKSWDSSNWLAVFRRLFHKSIVELSVKLFNWFQATKMSLGVDVCMTYERRLYFNLPEVQHALHANRTELPYEWSMCSK